MDQMQNVPLVPQRNQNIKSQQVFHPKIPNCWVGFQKGWQGPATDLLTSPGVWTWRMEGQEMLKAEHVSGTWIPFENELDALGRWRMSLSHIIGKNPEVGIRQCQVLLLPLLVLCDHRQAPLPPWAFLFCKWEKLEPALPPSWTLVRVEWPCTGWHFNWTCTVCWTCRFLFGTYSS